MSSKLLKRSLFALALTLIAMVGFAPSASASTRPGLEAVTYIEYHDMYKPYVYGATGPYAFDCSGLIQSAFWHSSWARLQRTAEAQYRQLSSEHHTFWSRRWLDRGDIIFFHNRSGYVFHEGIYVGNGLMLDANSTRGYVKWDSAFYNWGFSYETYGWVS